MATNKVATVVLFDVSQTMSAITDNGETFFERSLNCLKRMILRKIFSQDNDDIGLILFGSDITNNNLATAGCYRFIEEFSSLSLADWDLYNKVESMKISSVKKSDWVEGLVVAQDFMKNQTQGRKFKTKQLVVFCNLNFETSVYDDSVSTIVNALEGEKVQLIVIGNDLKEDCEGKELDTEVSSSLRLMFQCITNLKDAVQYSFSDIEKDLRYYENKRKMIRFYSVMMKIGSEIQLPMRWMKINKDIPRFRWEIPPEQKQSHATYINASNFNFEQKRPEPNIEYETDTVKRTNFGGTIIDLSYADLEALKRNTGPPSFIYLGSVKSGKISRSMFVGKDQYVFIPDKNARSVSMFSAFVDALLKAKKYGLARRVATKNGKIVVGALLPVSDEFGKAMYFLKLPFAEYVQQVPMFHLPVSNNTEARQAVDQLIETTMLPDDLVEEDKGVLVRDPTFQSRCHALYLRAVGKLPERSIIPLPKTVQEILNPLSLTPEAKNALKTIAKEFPMADPEEKSESPLKGKRHNKVKADPCPSSRDDRFAGKAPRTDYRTLAQAAMQQTKPISVHDSREVKDILNIANEDYDNIFSDEEMF